MSMTLKDGKNYDSSEINSEMLEEMGYKEKLKTYLDMKDKYVK